MVPFTQEADGAAAVHTAARAGPGSEESEALERSTALPDTAFFFWGGYIGDNGKENGNYYSILGFILGIMEKKMETTIVYWGYNNKRWGFRVWKEMLRSALLPSLAGPSILEIQRPRCPRPDLLTCENQCWNAGAACLLAR